MHQRSHRQHFKKLRSYFQIRLHSVTISATWLCHLEHSVKMSRFVGDTIVLICYMGLFIYLAACCRQKYYVLHHECSQALASYEMSSNCSRVDLFKERPVCEVRSMEDFVALRRMVLAVGLQRVCFRHYSDVIMRAIKSPTSQLVAQLFVQA